MTYNTITAVTALSDPQYSKESMNKMTIIELNIKKNYNLSYTHIISSHEVSTVTRLEQ